MSGRTTVAGMDSLKKFLLLMRYRIHRFATVLRRQSSFGLFLLSFVLFAIAIKPKFLRLFRESEFFSVTSDFVINGTVYTNVAQPGGAVLHVPLGNILVEVGADQMRTDAAGKFKLRFNSKSAENVPVIFLTGGKEVLKRVTFAKGQYVTELTVEL